MTLKDFLEIAGGFLGGAALSAVVTFNYTKTYYAKKNSVVQSGNKVGGDMSGGNMSKK